MYNGTKCVEAYNGRIDAENLGECLLESTRPFSENMEERSFWQESTTMPRLKNMSTRLKRNFSKVIDVIDEKH